MTGLFLKFINTSFSASWLILAVLILRFALKKAPKWVRVLLWGIVAVRLICPFSLESALSLIPSTEVIPEQVISGPSFDVQTGIGPVDDRINNYLGTQYFEGVTVPPNIGHSVMTVLTVVWLIGILLMAAYSLFSCLRLRRNVDTAVLYKDNVFQSECVGSPFVLGILKPKIYVPFHIHGPAFAHVVAHEQTHIRRKDHLWKPLGFLLLTLYWFNPLMWLAYVLLCRDIELACDEKVIQELGNEERANYTQTLVACSVDHPMIAACPLAFGEVGVKERVKSVMNYKKPAFWVIVLAILVCAALAVCFLTDPPAERAFTVYGKNISSLNTTAILEKITKAEHLKDSSLLCVNADNFDLLLTEDFDWANSGAIRFFYSEDQNTYSAQLRMFHDENKYYITERTEWIEQNRTFKLQHYLDALKYIPQKAVRKLSPDADGYMVLQVDYDVPADFDRVITYTPDGVTDLQGWYIHLLIHPMHQVSDGSLEGTGDEIIHLFYGHNDVRAGKYYLTVGSDGVKSIAITASDFSGGCENADGSLFKKGDRVWLDIPDGLTDLRGVAISALDENGKVLWSVSIPENTESAPLTHLVLNGWEISQS